MTQKQIIKGNAQIKDWLETWAPSLRTDYQKFNIPFEFHNNASRQYMVHGRFAIDFKHLTCYKEFTNPSLDDIGRFKILLRMVKMYKQMIALNKRIA